MDELELLKKDWNKTEGNYPNISKEDIYNMLHSKSSNIVKWIFYISLIEFSIGIILALINPQIETKIIYPKWFEIAWLISIPVILYFIYKFYTNYKNISSTDSVNKLITNILSTRKTVKHYVVANLIFVGIFSAAGIFIGYIQASGGLEKFNATAHFKEYALLIIAIVLLTVFMLAIVFGIYYLLYGLLLRQLNRNYKELQKLEV